MGWPFPGPPDTRGRTFISLRKGSAPAFETRWPPFVSVCPFACRTQAGVGSGASATGGSLSRKTPLTIRVGSALGHRVIACTRTSARTCVDPPADPDKTRAPVDCAGGGGAPTLPLAAQSGW